MRATLLSLALFVPGLAAAQDVEVRPTPALNQDRCIAQMADFPNDDPAARYQFFKLVSDTAYGADASTRAMLAHYGQPALASDTPVLAAIEDIANPVLRQAAPEITVASMHHLVDFAQNCEVYIQGQIDSLAAFDATLAWPEMDTAIVEDALFLRQILSESLTRLGADDDPAWADAAQDYTRSLVLQRDAVEFAAFEHDIAELETLYMDDLDGRLARSNDVINSEMDREILDDAITLSDDMTDAALEKARQERLYRLLRLFLGGR